MAILIRDKQALKSGLEETVLSKFFQPADGKHNSGIYRMENKTIIVDLSKLSGSHILWDIKVQELYDEFEINHYKFIGNNTYQPLFTFINMTDLGGDITIEYISPIKNSYIMVNSRHRYSGVKEIKGNISINFGSSFALSYANEGFWKLNKEILQNINDIYKLNGFAPIIFQSLNRFDEEKLSWQLEDRIDKKTAKQTLHDVLLEDTLYGFRYADGVCFLIKNPKQTTYKYTNAGKGIIPINIKDFKEIIGFQIYFKKK